MHILISKGSLGSHSSQISDEEAAKGLEEGYYVRVGGRVLQDRNRLPSAQNLPPPVEAVEELPEEGAEENSEENSEEASEEADLPSEDEDTAEGKE